MSTGDCIVTTELITISEPDPLVITSAINDVSCNGSTDGSVTIEVVGGSGGYIYNISEEPNRFQLDSTFTDLAAGVYQIVVQDDLGCFITQEIEILEPNPIVIGEITVIPTGNETSGSIAIVVSGDDEGYIYNLNDVSSSNGSFFDLAAGEYEVNVEDTNGCISETLTIILGEVNIDNSVIQNPETGLEANFKDAISYQWINVDTNTRIEEATDVNFIPSEFGQYQVEIEIPNDNTVVSSKGVNIVDITQIVLSPIINYTSGVLSIDDVTKESFKVYPNPATDFITVPRVLINKEFVIYNTLGNKVAAGIISGEENLELIGLSTGIYYLKVPSYQTVKIIKK